MTDRFGENFQRKRVHLTWRADTVGRAVKAIIQPDTVADFGCSVGEFVAWFNAHNVDAYGVDASPFARQFSSCPAAIHIADLTQPVEFRPMEAVLCFEVFSILDEWDGLIDNIGSHALKWALIALNPDKRRDLDARMAGIGFRREMDAEQSFRDLWEIYKHRPAMKALYHGIMVFRRPA